MTGERRNDDTERNPEINPRSLFVCELNVPCRFDLSSRINDLLSQCSQLWTMSARTSADHVRPLSVPITNYSKRNVHAQTVRWPSRDIISGRDWVF